MIVSREEQDKKIKEIKQGLKTYDESAVFRAYAKWYASKVIDRCAEEAETKLEDNPYSQREIVDTQSILKVKEEL